MLPTVLLLLAFTACHRTYAVQSNKDKVKPTSIETLIRNLEDSKDDKIIVIAHRGDWRNAPENSLQAIQNCMDMGVDMVEIDIHETKDGQLVLMHDKTIDRTTTGKGNVSDWTLDSLKTLFLKDGLGVPTTHKIPTLEAALMLIKGKILVNLDQSYDIFDKCYALLAKTGTLRQAIIKGVKTRQEVEHDFGKRLSEVHFMPIVRLPNPKARKVVDDYLKHGKPVAFEFTVPQDTFGLIGYFGTIRQQGASVWVNALWKQHNGGHDDEKAALDPTVYDWFIDNHIDMIQTDRPQILLNYLRSKKRHE